MEKINITYLPIEGLKVYPNNPRKNGKAVDIVMKSIQAFGFRNPILIDKDNVIIAGHTRLEAAKKLGYTEVPTIFINDLTPEQVNAFRIMDNKSSEFAEWDSDLLKTELELLKSLNFDLELTGFNELELNRLIPEDILEEELPNSKAPKHEVKLGDIWQLGPHRLMCGDSTNEQMVTQLMNGKVATLMVTDPPYGVNYDPKWRDEADKKGILGNKYPTRAMGLVQNDDRIDWSDAYKLFNGDVAYVWHAGKYSGEVKDSLVNVGYEMINQIIWVKPHFALSRGDYHWQHEPCWYAVRKGKNHNWQGSRKETTVWDIANLNAFGKSKDEDERTDHSTQKPVECMARPIRRICHHQDWLRSI